MSNDFIYLCLEELLILLLILLFYCINSYIQKRKKEKEEYNKYIEQIADEKIKNVKIPKVFEYKKILTKLNGGDNMEIKFEFISNVDTKFLTLPKRSTKSAAGYDFYNPDEVTIQPKEIKIVKTKVKAKFPEDMMLLLLNRSSNAKKKGLVLMNGIGLIDADYYNNEDNEGEIGFMFMNINNEPVTIYAGDKLGQGVFTKYFKTIDDDETTTDRIGGWGSTGK